MLEPLLSLSQVTESAPQSKSTFERRSTFTRRTKRSPGKRFSRWRRRHLLEISLGLLIIALLGFAKPLGKGKLPARTASVSNGSDKSGTQPASTSAPAAVADTRSGFTTSNYFAFDLCDENNLY